MPKRSSTASRDLNRNAARVAALATREPEPRAKPARKNPAAVALGRRGGLKGGKARAAALSPKQRSEIARKAARARWAVEP